MKIYDIKEANTTNSIFIIKENFLDPNDLATIKYNLKNINDWKITNKYNSEQIQRLQKWYQIDNLSFGKNWKVLNEQWKSNKYDDYLLGLQTKIQDKVNKLYNNFDIEQSQFNSLLINYYQNGNNGISPHRDDTSSFGLEPTIALLSINGPRTLCIERTHLDSLKRDKSKYFLNREFVLNDNSLLIMAGGSQRNFCHYLLSEPDNQSSRYSLTFREFIN
jgi:alkylated DNA repair dioxygenase AlkB